MQSPEWTRMGVAAAIAVVAMSFLAADAFLDLSSSGVAGRLETARASIADAAASQYQHAIAVQAWARRNSFMHHSTPL